MKHLRALCALAFALTCVHAQQRLPNTTVQGTFSASTATATTPNATGTSLPGTCTVGQTFFKTDATAGANIYQCTATDSWTAPATGSGGGIAGPAAVQSGQTINITCGSTCYVNGSNMDSFSGSVTGFPAVTRTDYIYVQGGVVKYGYSGTAPSTLTNVTGVSGISAMPAGSDIVPVATASISSGTLAAVPDVRNAAVSQPVNYAFNPSYFVTQASGGTTTVTPTNGNGQIVGVRHVFTGSGTYDYTVPLTTATVAPIAICGTYSGAGSFSASFPSTGTLRITATGAGTAECTVLGALAYAYDPGQDFLLAISPTSATADASLQAATTATISAGNGSGWTSALTFTCKAPCPGSVAFTPSNTLTGTGTRTATATLSTANSATFTIAATAADGTERTVTFPVAVTYAPIYSYIRTLSVAAQASTLTSFPVLVDITDNTLRSVANGGHVQSANGYDVVFATDTAGATAIANVEKEFYDPVTGHWRGWVPVTLSSSVTTNFYMFYGYAGATTSQYVGTPWDTNYSSVLHMDSTLGLMYDSARAATGSLTTGTSASTTGKVGTAFNFDGSTYWTLSNVSNWPTGPRQPYTISFWANVVNNAQNTIISAGNNTDFQVIMPILGDSSTPGIVVMEHHNDNHAFGSCTFSTAQTNHWVISYDGTTETLYKNGTTCGTPATPSTSLNLQAGSTVMLGAPEFLTGVAHTNGWVDELRVEKLARPSAWASAVYATQNAPGTFATLGSEGAAH